MMYRLDLSRILSKWRVIAPAILVCAAMTIYGDDVPADLEAYKAQVVEDTYLISQIIIALEGDLSGIYSHASALAVSSDQSTAARGQMILEVVNSASARADSVSKMVSSINHVASALVLPAQSNALCNCGAQLDSINTKLATILADCEWINQQLQQSYYPNGDGTENFFDSVALLLNDNVECLSSISNALWFSTSANIAAAIPSFNTRIRQGVNKNQIFSQRPVSLSSVNGIKSLSLLGLLQEWSAWNSFALNSLNNYAYTNEFAVASIARTLVEVRNSLTNKTSSMSWNYVVEVDRSPLDQVASDYYTHLTNEYLATWSANDNPNTNWFRRVEILLASLVFRDSGHQDELDEIEEALPSSSDLSGLESALDASEMFDVDIGGQFFDNAPSLPDFGSQLPQTLSITIPSFGGDDSQSASTSYTIDIDVNSISSICDAVRACFRFLWWGLVALLVFFLGRWFLRGCSLSFRLIQGIHFS